MEGVPRGRARTVPQIPEETSNSTAHDLGYGLIFVFSRKPDRLSRRRGDNENVSCVDSNAFVVLAWRL